MAVIIFYVVVNAIIIILWEKGKSDALYVAFNVAFMFSNGIVIYKVYNGIYKYNIFIIGYAGLYFLGILFMFIILRTFMDVSKQVGEKDLLKIKDIYENLIKKEILDASETRILKNLTKIKNKNDFKYQGFNNGP